MGHGGSPGPAPRDCGTALGPSQLPRRPHWQPTTSSWCHARVPPSKSLCLIDHRDSFTHNLARYLAELGWRPQVMRAEAVDLEQLRAANPGAIVLGPGPGPPERATLARQVFDEFTDRPVLGVCLGHQVLALAHGAQVTRGAQPVHGRADPLEHSGRGLLRGVAPRFRAARYHSLTVVEESLPDHLQVDARSPDGAIQALRSLRASHFGLQFHPESILGEWGHRILGNFLETIVPVDAS